MISARLRYELRRHRWRTCARYRYERRFGKLHVWNHNAPKTYNDELRERALIVGVYYHDDAHIKLRAKWLLQLLKEKHARNAQRKA